MFLILFCLFVTIKNWAMRQRTNAHKFVICNFNTQNHLKMAKICILRPKNATFIQSHNPGPLQHTFMTPSLCVLRPRNVKSNFQKYFEIFIFGGFGRFWAISNHSASYGSSLRHQHSDRKWSFSPRGASCRLLYRLEIKHYLSGSHSNNTISKYMSVVARRNQPTPSEEDTSLFWWYFGA